MLKNLTRKTATRRVALMSTHLTWLAGNLRLLASFLFFHFVWLIMKLTLSQLLALDLELFA